MKAAVAAALYHYFKTHVVSAEVREQVGTQSSLAYYFDIFQGTHWNSMEVWLTSYIFKSLKI